MSKNEKSSPARKSAALSLATIAAVGYVLAVVNLTDGWRPGWLAVGGAAIVATVGAAILFYGWPRLLRRHRWDDIVDVIQDEDVDEPDRAADR